MVSMADSKKKEIQKRRKCKFGFDGNEMKIATAWCVVHVG
jgi:hypothetical protein